MKTKLILFFLLISLALPTANAVYVQDPILMQSSGYSSYITLGSGNFSQIEVTSSNLIVNDSMRFNSTANTTISAITNNGTVAGFTGQAASGILKASAKLTAQKKYGLYVDSSKNTTGWSNTAGWVDFNYSAWSTHTFEVFAEVLGAPIISSYSPTKYYPLRSGTQQIFQASADQDVTWYWTNNNKGVSSSDTLTSTSYASSWTKGLNYLRLYGSNTYGTTDTIEWRVPILRTMASAPVPTVNQSAYENIYEATEALDFMAWISATTGPYTATLGNYFYLFLWLMVFSALWIRQGSITLPSVLGLVLGGAVIGMLPEEYRVYSIALIALGAIAVLYLIFTERR